MTDAIKHWYEWVVCSVFATFTGLGAAFIPIIEFGTAAGLFVYAMYGLFSYFAWRKWLFGIDNPLGVPA